MSEKEKGKNKIRAVILLMSVIGSAIIFSRAFSYDSDIAHPNIAELAGELYNGNSTNDLSQQEINWLKQGAIDEDTPIRWMNHFYDPIADKGIFLIKRQYSAKKWSQSPSEQEKFTLGDYSWQRAIYDYQQGNKKEAFIGLGHIIHLISDMSVPAHTRDDIHIKGDAYEQFVKNNYDLLSKGLENVETRMFYFDRIDKYFNNLANYSNNNFYSDDTIKDEKYYIIPEIAREEIKIGNYYKIIYINKDIIDGNNYYTYIDNVDAGWGISKDYEAISSGSRTLNHQLLLTSYTKQLFPKAIGYSAGIIKLFFEEVEKEHDFDFKEDRENVDPINYLLGYAIEKLLAFGKDKDIKLGDAILADENTVLTIMNEGYTLNEEQEEQNEESPPISEVVVKDQPAAVDEPANFEETITEEPPVEPETEPTDDEAKTAQKQVLGVKINNETDNSSMKFVFGPGGETNQPILTNEEVGEETSSTTEEVVAEETATTTEVEFVDEIPTDVGEIVDTQAPIVDLTASTAGLVLATSTTSTLNIYWQGEDDFSGLDYYDIEYKIDDGDWMGLLSQTSSTEYTMAVEKLKTYNFRVRAVDKAGNISDWKEAKIIIDWPKAVVINEVAWMGTASTKSQDEWLELYNNTNEDIDLSNWSLLVSGKKITWNKISPIIKANDYYLLERTDDTTVSDIKADGIFTISGGLKNTGENITLLNGNGEIIDEISNASGWFAGEAGVKYKTMERINSDLPGNWDSNWQTSDTFSPKGKGDGGGRIYGTPRQPNHGYWFLQALTTHYADFFDENKVMTLTAENNPYFIDSGSGTEIPAGYTLKLEPGVIIAGAGNSAYMKVAGNLIIEGTEANSVVFTSTRDTNYIKYNGTDLEGEEPQAGDWSRIEIKPNGKLEANNVKFLYGAHPYEKTTGWVYGTEYPAHIILNLGGEAIIDGAVFENSFIHEDEEDNIYDVIVWVEPERGYFASTTINNSVFDYGYTAVKAKGGNNYLSIENSTFRNFNNPNGVISTDRILPYLSDNFFENNVFDALFVSRFIAGEDRVLSSGVKYVFGSIDVYENATLTLEPGVDLRMNARGNIKVNGNLRCLGAVDNPITVGSFQAGVLWGNLIFNGSAGVLEYTNISGGNFGSAGSPDNGMIWMDEGNVILDNVSLLDARRPYNMVYAKNSELSISNSLISWSTPKEGDTNITGIDLDGGHLHLNNVRFNEMDRAVEGHNGATAEMENMFDAHFTNISDLNWYPAGLLTVDLF